MTISKIEVKDLCYQYDHTHVVFDSVCASLPTNEIVYLDGSVGSGRSTLLKMMAALVIPQKGSVFFNDQELSEMSFEEFLPTRLKIGYTFEYAGLLHNRTIFENLLLPIQYHSLCSENQARKRVQDLCERFQLQKVTHLRPSAVSGSQRKACVVARAFVMNPELILLDEPFTGLNPSVALEFKNLVSEQMKTENLQHVFVTAQNWRDIEDWATSRVVVESHRIATLPVQKSNKSQGAA